MEERPDHLVTFHVTIPLKTPAGLAKFVTLRVADPEYFIDFEFDDKDPVKLVCARPPAARPPSPSPSRSRRPTNPKLTEFFFTNLSPGTNFGFKMASSAIIACP